MEWPLTLGETLQMGMFILGFIGLRRSQRASSEASERSIKEEITATKTEVAAAKSEIRALTDQVTKQNGRVGKLEGAVHGMPGAPGINERLATLEAAGCG